MKSALHDNCPYFLGTEPIELALGLDVQEVLKTELDHCCKDHDDVGQKRLPNLTEIVNAVSSQGYHFMANVAPEDALRLLQGLGTTLFVTDVTVRPNSKALVTSDRALDYHTDHQRADLVCWHCIEQSDEGGQTLLLDGYRLLAQLDAQQREHLKGLRLFEHKVFDGDPDYSPFLSQRFGRDRIYYSFWMIKGEVDPDKKAAVMAFKKLTEHEPPVTFTLQPRDLLIIDNGRMLHGRSAIGGNKKRFLKRYWIQT